MKHYKDVPLYPIVRRSFKSYSDLGAVINRKKTYICQCLNGHRSFSDIEKRLILAAMGMQNTEANMLLVFPEVQGNG